MLCVNRIRQPAAARMAEAYSPQTWSPTCRRGSNGQISDRVAEDFDGISMAQWIGLREKIQEPPHDLHGKIHGFRLRFSRLNQSSEFDRF